jgi:hypothetical protein
VDNETTRQRDNKTEIGPGADKKILKTEKWDVEEELGGFGT